MKPTFKTVGKVGDIAPGTGKTFEFGDQMVAIFLETDGTYLAIDDLCPCLLYTSPSPRDQRGSRMPSSA